MSSSFRVAMGRSIAGSGLRQDAQETPRPQRLMSRATRDFLQFGLGCAPVGPKRNAPKSFLGSEDLRFKVC